MTAAIYATTCSSCGAPCRAGGYGCPACVAAHDRVVAAAGMTPAQRIARELEAITPEATLYRYADEAAFGACHEHEAAVHARLGYFTFTDWDAALDLLAEKYGDPAPCAECGERVLPADLIDGGRCTACWYTAALSTGQVPS